MVSSISSIKAPRAHRSALPGNHTEQLDYAYALAHDLPVGPGLIESGHRHFIQDRLKNGAWWPQANSLCQLRSLRANRMWNHYWENN